METIVCGAIGGFALLVVGKIGFSAGYDAAEMDYKYSDKKNEPTPDFEHPPACIVEEKRPNVISSILGARRMRSSPLSDLLRNPESHKLEAWVDDGEIRVTLKKRQ